MKPPVVRSLHLDEHKLPAQVFERLVKRGDLLRDRKRRREEAWENFGKAGRDPKGLGAVLTQISGDPTWNTNLMVARLRNHWDQVVGEDIARHSHVASFVDGVLVIRAETGVWATQLTYLIPQLTDTVRERLAGLEVREIKVTGPASMQFKRRWVR
ncbi:hypothetical protein BLEM_2241 [Bifidobacterium lemurum]|uniref:Zn-ribbon-containing RNA-binding protein n=1 Tax=Bifidobacterium lemurum TaxID=1603886 RepID=A0A261FLR3_9BIFI|nr:DUF721 domain-containing protein [Bifidobacterium lemurum]OZG59766.1 hypothetical protein BLEM_2241 [Bifidobacterium lemurum]QOL35383.1 DUF721 domain-containing protein [Bifidobacterium lemurum]